MPHVLRFQVYVIASSCALATPTGSPEQSSENPPNLTPLAGGNSYSPNLRAKCQRIEAVENPAEREKAINALVAEIEKKDPQEMLSCMEALPSSPLTNLLRARLIRNLVVLHPEYAALRIDRLPLDAVRRYLVSYLGSVWARQDLAQAAAWARKRTLADERISAIFCVAAEAVTTDRALAAKLIAELPEGEATNNLRNELARKKGR